jgi:hypothetical protein
VNVKEAVGGSAPLPTTRTGVLAPTLPAPSAARTKNRPVELVGTVICVADVVAIVRSSRRIW